MSTIKALYGTEKQAITISLAPGGVGLANGNVRQSAVVDNTANLFLDALVQFQIKSGASGVSTSGVVNVYAYGTVDAADSLYTDGASGADASITLTSPTNMRLIGVINVVANATSYVGGPFSVASGFSGILPEKWGICLENKSGAALDTTEGNHLKFYQGIQSSVV